MSTQLAIILIAMIMAATAALISGRDIQGLAIFFGIILTNLMTYLGLDKRMKNVESNTEKGDSDADGAVGDGRPADPAG